MYLKLVAGIVDDFFYKLSLFFFFFLYYWLTDVPDRKNLQALVLILSFGCRLANVQGRSLSMDVYCKNRVSGTLKVRNTLKNGAWQCCNVLLIIPHLEN